VAGVEDERGAQAGGLGLRGAPRADLALGQRHVAAEALAELRRAHPDDVALAGLPLRNGDAEVLADRRPADEGERGLAGHDRGTEEHEAVGPPARARDVRRDDLAQGDVAGAGDADPGEPRVGRAVHPRVRALAGEPVLAGVQAPPVGHPREPYTRVAPISRAV
jgi:hypothetical protein